MHLLQTAVLGERVQRVLCEDLLRLVQEAREHSIHAKEAQALETANMFC